MPKTLLTTAAALLISISGIACADELEQKIKGFETTVQALATGICPKVVDQIERLTCEIEFSSLPLAVRLTSVKVTMAVVARGSGDKTRADRISAEIAEDYSKILANVDKLQKKYDKYTK